MTAADSTAAPRASREESGTFADPHPPTVIRDVQVGLRGRTANVRVAGGVVADVGDEIESAPGDDVLDGRGLTVLPGLWDAHVHAGQWAQTRRRIDLSAVRSAQQAVKTVADAQREQPHPGSPSDLVMGYGFRDGLWAERPDKSMIEAALPGKPVALISNDLHTTWLSPAALSLIGWPDHPTGVLREADALHAQQLLPAASVAERDRWAVEALQAAAARGVTGITDFEYGDNVADWSRRHNREPLPLRVATTIYPPYLDDAIERRLRTGMHVTGCGAMLEVGPVKVFIDGSLNTRTALCEHPYPGIDDPAEANGLLLTDSEELVQLMERAAQRGLETAAHAIGDTANRFALDAFERVGCRGRIEHAQLLHEDDVPRFARLGITAGVQPAHAIGDRDVADYLWAGRTERSFCYALMVAAGVTIEIGSDAPVAPLDPWKGIAAAVARTDGQRPPWHPEQAIDIDDAMAAASRGRRTVDVGDPADLVLVGANPAYLSPHDLQSIPVVASMVAGRWTYRTSV